MERYIDRISSIWSGAAQQICRGGAARSAWRAFLAQYLPELNRKLLFSGMKLLVKISLECFS
jgi:hypothetical protein